MFEGNSSLIELDLSNFTINEGANTEDMFLDNNNLKNIYVKDSVEKTKIEGLVSNCEVIIKSSE